MKVFKVLNRIHLEPSKLDETIKFYEKLLKSKCELRFHHKGLELANIGSILLIAGSKEVTSHFKKTKITLLVDSLKEFRSYLIEADAVPLTNQPSLQQVKICVFPIQAALWSSTLNLKISS
jgi:hypothetical protein